MNAKHNIKVGSLVEIINEWPAGVRLYVTHAYYSTCCGEPVYALSVYPADSSVRVNDLSDPSWRLYGQFRILTNVPEIDLMEVKVTR